MRRASSALFVLTALCTSAPAPAGDAGRAGAQQAAHEAATPRRPAARVGVEAMLTTSPSGPTVSSFGGSLRAAGEYRLAHGLAISLEGGVSSVSLEVDGRQARSGAFPGNLLLGASLERAWGPRLDAGASLRVGAPLALYPGGIDDNRLADLAYSMAASAHGFRDPFLWQINAVPLVVGVHASLRPLDWLTLSGQLEPALLVSVNQRPSRWAAATQLDAGAVFEPFVAHIGVAHFASTLPLENRDRDQLALRFGAGALVNGQRFMVDLAIGLDEPYGAFQSAPHPWWGVGIVADVSFGADRPLRPEE